MTRAARKNRFPLPLLILAPVLCGYGLLATTAWGTEQYAEKFKAKCKFCHLRNTSELNEVGQQIKKDMATAQKAAETKEKASGGGQTGKEAAGDANGVKSADGIAEKEEGKKPAKADEAPSPVYRWTGRNGELSFSDNGDRKADAPVEQQKPKTVKKAQRRTARLPAKEAPVVKASAPAPPQKVQPYDRCMEETLASRPQPASGREMMDMLMEAERNCAAVALRRVP